MAEQQTATVEADPIWTPVQGKPGLEAAKKPIIENSPRVVPEVQEKYRELIAKINAGEIKKEEGQKHITQTFELGEHVYGITQFEDTGGFSIWRRKKGTGGGGGKKVFLKLKSFKTGSEKELNEWIASHPNNNYDIIATSYADFTTGVQQFIITERVPVGSTQEQGSEKTEETKSA